MVHRVRPKDHMRALLPVMPTRYAPLQSNGNGIQSVYLTELPAPFAEVLAGLIGAEAQSIPRTDREAIIRARRGQGIFTQRVMEIEQRCRITGVTNPVHLIASHGKPWRDSTNAERLNGENGLLLTPSIDQLFDRGFIGFEANGNLIVSPVAHRPSLERMEDRYA
jgi:hypothetical protein